MRTCPETIHVYVPAAGVEQMPTGTSYVLLAAVRTITDTDPPGIPYPASPNSRKVDELSFRLEGLSMIDSPVRNQCQGESACGGKRVSHCGNAMPAKEGKSVRRRGEFMDVMEGNHIAGPCDLSRRLGFLKGSRRFSSRLQQTAGGEVLRGA